MFFFILAKLYFLFLLYFTQLPQYHSYNVLSMYMTKKQVANDKRLIM